MRFSHSRAQLLAACTAADNAVASRTTMPIMTCIKLIVADRKIVAMGTDNELGVRYEMPAEDIEVDGTGVLPPDKLLPFLKECHAETLKIRELGDAIHIAGNGAKLTLTTQNGNDFPDVPPIGHDGETCEVNRLALMDAIARTLPCADKTEATARWAVSGLLVEVGKDGLTIVGTDTRRLAVANLSANRLSEPVSGLLPRKACESLLRTLANAGEEAVTFRLTKNAAVFACGPLTLHTKLVEGRFPPYRDIIPKKPTSKFQIPRGEFAAAVKLAGGMADNETRRVDFNFDGGAVEMVAKSTLGASDVKLELPGYISGRLEIAFNPAYLLDCLRVCAGETLSVETTDGQRPAVFRDGADYLHLIMPLTG